MLVYIGLSIIFGSSVVGAYLDIKKKCNVPVVYWLLGFYAGFLGCLLILRGLQC